MSKAYIKPLAFLTASLLLSTAVHANNTEILVSAAASLSNAFKEVGLNYEAQYPDIKVVFSFAASDTLQRQIVNGAPADIFASADQIAMDKAVGAGVINKESRTDFALNKIVLIVPSSSKLNINSVNDLNNDDVTRVALGSPETVPAGRYTQGSLEKLGVWNSLQPKQVLGQNVRQVLDYVARDEVDAGFVFATDAAIMPDKVYVITTLETTVPALYPIALVDRKNVHPKAEHFLEYILSDKGSSVLEKYGFSKP